MPDLKGLVEEIKNFKLDDKRGATDLLLEALEKIGAGIKTDNVVTWLSQFKRDAEALVAARPTDPLMQNGIRFILYSLESEGCDTVAEMQKTLKEAVEYFVQYLEESREKIVKNCQKFLKNNDHVFVHGYSFLLKRVFKATKQANKNIFVYQSEMRPYLQGRKFAKSLCNLGITNTLMVDSLAPSFIAQALEDTGHEIDKVLIEAEGFLENGWAVVPVGGYSLALAARTVDIPVYIVGELLQTDEDGKIMLEKRPGNQVWQEAPKGVTVVNQLFELVPSLFIDEIITESGSINPKKLKKTVKKNYPWLLDNH